MKIYRGKREKDKIIVSVEEDDGECYPLFLRFGLENHSPTGFEWGYRGSGPAQLALAILADCLGDYTSKLLYHDFKETFVANWRENAWGVTDEEIWFWLCQRKYVETLVDEIEGLNNRIDDYD